MYYVYIISNKYNSVFYTGVTKNINRRIYEHRNKILKGFTKKYNISKLLYFNEFDNINDAIEFEKKIKGRNRSKKEELIIENNPNFEDLVIVLE